LHVDQILDYLGLTHVTDQRVGSIEKRGISGGERKRVSIALGIVAMPMAVILDEPTSGLDATTALSIMNLLKSLSTLGITVICAIHQPRRDIYQLLDDIIVLNLGKQIYLGETSTAHKHFETLGSVFPAGCNPADVIIDCVTNLPSSASHHYQGNPTDRLPTPLGDRISGSTMQMAELRRSFIQHKATWYRQVLLYLLCGIKQQHRQIFSQILEISTAAAAGILIGLSIYEFKGHIFQGYFRQPFGLLSSAVNYTTVPTTGILCSLAISK
jgi:ABC-type multidrug transport system ATPase subunit